MNPAMQTRTDHRLTIRQHVAPEDVPADDWQALLARCDQPTPFMRHEWLTALHASACASPETGWTLLMLTAWQGNDTDANTDQQIHPTLVGACVAYVKTHSYGEYVFDWAWARAYEQTGRRYYPKLVCASPFTPVPGTRLLTDDADVKVALLQGLAEVSASMGLSSAHLLLGDAQDQLAAQRAGWLLRHGVQFHWHNRHVQPYSDMADFLAALHRDRRKKIQQERRKVNDAGVQIRALEGRHIRAEDWAFFYKCYEQTYLAHGAPPYLTLDFFLRVAASLPDHWLLFVASQGGQDVATSLVAIDRDRRVAWGRYWGAVAHIPCLHFEMCYYSPLQWCIEQGFDRFEGGAQGEHKMARGLMPVDTWSAHCLHDPGFARAVANFLAHEAAHMGNYVDELNERQVFRDGGPLQG